MEVGADATTRRIAAVLARDRLDVARAQVTAALRAQVTATQGRG